MVFFPPGVRGGFKVFVCVFKVGIAIPITLRKRLFSSLEGFVVNKTEFAACNLFVPLEFEEPELSMCNGWLQWLPVVVKRSLMSG